MMRCTVIGTSNSIMKVSYRPFLERSGVFERVRNLSVGGTPNIIAPYMLAQNKIEEGEVVILETSVNDTWCIQGNRLPSERVAAVEFEVVDHLNSLGAVPVILIMPTIADSQCIDQVRAICYDLEKRGKAHVLDGYPILWALQAETGVPIADLFLDDGHVITHVAGAIASRLIKHICFASDAMKASRRQRTSRPLPYFVRELYNIAKTSIHKTNSQYSVRYGILEGGDVLEATFDEEVQLLGVSFNASGSSAVVEISADDGEAHAYDFRSTKQITLSPRTFTHALAPIPTEVIGSRIRARVLTDVEAAKRSIIPLGHGKFRNVNLGHFELEAFLLRKGREPEVATPMPSSLPGATQLTHEERMVAQFIDVGHSTTNLSAAGRLFSNLFHSSRNYSSDAKADLMRDIGRIALRVGNYEVARRVLAIALRERPKAEYIRRLLQEARSREDEAARSGPSV